MTKTDSDSRFNAARDLAMANEAFYVPLRSGLGFDEQRFEALREALRQCAVEWADDDVIPKLAANIFIDLFSALEACSYLYEEKIAEKIRRAADELADLARRSVVVDFEGGEEHQH